MNHSSEVLIDVIKQACFPERYNQSVFSSSINWESIYEIAKQHSIQCLTYSSLKNQELPSDVKTKWKTDAYKQLFINIRIIQVEKEVLQFFRDASVPVAIIKGSSAAQYYPKPEYRSAGDIDLLVRTNEYEKACFLLEKKGCIDTTTDQEKQRGRHRCYRYHGVEIELHRFFSLLPEQTIASEMDELLYSGIRQDSIFLSPILNGLVLLEHIYQHLETGLGLRQIIDWMMYVHCILKDDKWREEFQGIARACGLETLAQTLTRMCQSYLGLEKEGITWGDMIEDEVCIQLLDYVLDSGNFGNNRGFLQTNDITQLPSIKSPILIFKFLQERGRKTWTCFNKYFFLRPFAWIAQGISSIKQLARNKAGLLELKEAYQEGLRRKHLFESLDIKQRGN